MFSGILTQYTCIICIIMLGRALPVNSAIAVDAVESESKSLRPPPGRNVTKVQKLYLELFNSKGKHGQILDPLIHLSRKVNPEDFSGGCSRGSFYYSFNTECQKSVYQIQNLLQRERNTTVLIRLARRLKSHPLIHPKAWYSALTRVTLLRPDLRGLYKPAPINIMPDAFLSSTVIGKIRRAAAAGGSTRNSTNSPCVVVDEKFGADNLEENRLWYFREDIQVNSHHWYWHNTYPSYLGSTLPNIRRADRRGELFYYVHHSMLARYNTERLANNLPFAPPVNLQHGYIMTEGYYAHLNDVNSGRNWADRRPRTVFPESVALQGSPVTTVNHVYLNHTIESTQHLYQSIDNGYFQTLNQTQISLQTFYGIDLLGDAVEAANFSVNIPYYGNVHNEGHELIAFSHDPTNPNAAPQVMADFSTSMRDPIFYNWHTFIDDIFDRHKRRLPPYQLDKGDFTLVWKSVRVEHVHIYSSKGRTNKLDTFWSYKNLTLNRGIGLDRNPASMPPVNICVKHLNHEEFQYNIVIFTIPNGFSLSTRVTIRIFMAPRTGSNGKRLTMEEQRPLFFAMDAFTASLTPGLNSINRPSSRSTLTIPWTQSIDILQDVSDAKPYCGCGWPYHLLLPKGTPGGMTFDLFVMATNGDEDRVLDPDLNTKNTCKDAYLLCGLPPYRKYPDSKPMGYPFDRESRVNYGSAGRAVGNIEEFAQVVQNTYTTQVLIQHVDKLQKKKQRQQRCHTM